MNKKVHPTTWEGHGVSPMVGPSHGTWRSITMSLAKNRMAKGDYRGETQDYVVRFMVNNHITIRVVDR